MIGRLAAALAFVLVFAIGCSKEDKPAAPADVDDVARDMVDAVGTRDVETLMRHVAMGFRGGPAGREANLGYAEVQAIALEFLLRDHPLSARVDGLKVEPAETAAARHVSARVWFDASTALADVASAVPETAVAYRFDLRFERREGTWQVVSGTYERDDAPSGG